MMKSAHHNPTFCSRYKQKATSVGKQVNDIARRHSERFRFECGTAVHALVYARTGSDEQGIAQGNAAGYLSALSTHGLPLLGAEHICAETDYAGANKIAQATQGDESDFVPKWKKDCHR
jgi:hypothetical protein